MGLLGFMQERKDAQWYLPEAEYTADAKDQKAGIIPSVKERSSVFGTAMFLDLTAKDGSRVSTKVSGQIAEAIRDSKKPLDEIEVDFASIVITKLALTDTAKATEAGAKLRENIYRASFSWE